MKYLVHNAIKKARQRRNVEFLSSKLIHLGFGEDLSGKIAAKLREDLGKFQLATRQDFDVPGRPRQPVDYTLLFKKGGIPEHHYLYAYHARLRNDPGKSQMFTVSDSPGAVNFTAREAFNLLQGRAVNKIVHDPRHEKPVNTWFQLNRQRDNHGNFSIDTFPFKNFEYILAPVLNKYPIKEIEDTTAKIDLIKSLYAGNLENVTLRLNGQDEKMHIAAAPHARDLRFYDQHLVQRNRTDLRKDRPGKDPEIGENTLKPKRKGITL